MRADPAMTVPWLTAPYRWFGEKLGTVLFRVPKDVRRDDAALAGLLAAWPAEMALTMEFQDRSWDDDEIHALLRQHEAVLCATDLDELESPPMVRATGRFLYLRLRRTTYTDAELDEWAHRVEPFLADGRDVFVFFRHDEDGESAVRAEAFQRRFGDPRDPG